MDRNEIYKMVVTEMSVGISMCRGPKTVWSC